MRDENGLTGKQAAFVEHYTTDCECNGIKSARLAGYAGCDNVLRVIACENLTKPNISKAITLKREKLAKKVDVSVEFIVEKLLYGLQVATDHNNTVAMARFLELLGRYKAMFTDNLSVNDVQRQRELDERERLEVEELVKLRITSKYGLISPGETSCKAIVKVDNAVQRQG